MGKKRTVKVEQIYSLVLDNKVGMRRPLKGHGWWSGRKCYFKKRHFYLQIWVKLCKGVVGTTKNGGSDVGGTRDGERTERGTISGGVYEVFRAICLKDILEKSMIEELLEIVEKREHEEWWVNKGDKRAKEGKRRMIFGGYWHEQGKPDCNFFEHKHKGFVVRNEEGGLESNEEKAPKEEFSDNGEDKEEIAWEHKVGEDRMDDIKEEGDLLCESTREEMEEIEEEGNDNKKELGKHLLCGRTVEEMPSVVDKKSQEEWERKGLGRGESFLGVPKALEEIVCRIANEAGSRYAEFFSEEAKIIRSLGKKVSDGVVLPCPFRYGEHFHFFITSYGSVRYHVDQSNYFVFLFPIKTPAEDGVNAEQNAEGGLEFSVGEDSVLFSWRVGDAVMFDAGDIPHRTRECSQQANRMVGTLMIRKSMLSFYGVIDQMNKIKIKTEEQFEKMKETFKPYDEWNQNQKSGGKKRKRKSGE